MVSLSSIMPSLEWIRKYTRANLYGDINAGILVGVMLVPQGMAYAMLAGLPPVMGLYSAVVPLIVYALFGSSRQLAVGPVAMISLLTITSLSPLAHPGSAEYVALVLQLSLMVGVIQLLLGALRMGMMVNFLSHAVISGFTSAAAVLIILSQVKHIFGIKVQSAETAIELAAGVLGSMSGYHMGTAVLGLGSIAVLLVLRWKYPRFPASLLIVILGTLGVGLLGLNSHGIKVVGVVPSGLPIFATPAVSVKSVTSLLPAALAITFVGYMESIAIAKMIASRERYRIFPNTELGALGLANAIGSFFGAYPITGSFSRSAVNYQAGAKTGLASLITAVIVILALIFLTPAFYFLPNAVLGAVVVAAVIKLIDVDEARRLFHLRSSDGWVLVITFLTTLTFGAIEGIIAGILLSLIVFVWRSANPHVAELGFVDSEKGFRDVTRFPGAKTFPNALILRIDRSLYFANMGFVEDTLREYILGRPSLQWVVLDFSGVNSIDAVSVIDLLRFVKLYQEKGISFVFAEVKAAVRDVLERADGPNESFPYIEGECLDCVLSRIGVVQENSSQVI